MPDNHSAKFSDDSAAAAGSIVLVIPRSMIEVRDGGRVTVSATSFRHMLFSTLQ